MKKYTDNINSLDKEKMYEVKRKNKLEKFYGIKGTNDEIKNLGKGYLENVIYPKNLKRYKYPGEPC